MEAESAKSAQAILLSARKVDAHRLQYKTASAPLARFHGGSLEVSPPVRRGQENPNKTQILHGSEQTSEEGEFIIQAGISVGPADT